MNKQIVYVIDDNDMYRKSACWLLEGMQYQYAEFDKPEAGLQSIADNDDCTCLLLDVRMPTMSGLEVHDKLLKTTTSIPVIYMTGHGQVSLAVEAMKKGAITFLEKPLDPEALRNALDKAFAYVEENRNRVDDDNKVCTFKK